ncbi:MAG: DNA polymerase elongation subunit (family B) [archaeon]
MRLVIFDFEVFKYDWTVTFLDMKSKETKFIHNNKRELRNYIEDKPLLCGWNNKWYDDWILLALIKGADNLTLKSINDWIIGGNNPWEHQFLAYTKKYPYSMDLRNDVYYGIGLKEIEGNLGMSIEEASIPWDLERPLTDEELNEIKKYNIHDVKATMELFNQRKDYLKNKIFVGNMIGLPQYESLGLTNAKLSAKFLKAEKKLRHDERVFEFPENLDFNYIPDELIEFFELSNDDSYTDDEIFKRKINVPFSQDMECIYGYGGVHAGKPNYWKNPNKKLYLSDVSSLYPTIMIEYDLLSRNVPNPELYKEIYDARLKAKAENDYETSEALKLIINTTYGAMLNKWNDLYDPRMGRHVPIYGQLFLTELLYKLLESCPTIEIINFNTDGILYELDDSDYEIAQKVMREWEKKNRFKLDTEEVENIIQKDVNNYIASIDGKIKTKGSMVKCFGGGDFESNSIVVVANAIVNYFLEGKPVEQTISETDNILDFQFIAKTGSSYLKTYYSKFDGENHIKDYQEVQKVNRVYASKNKEDGTLYKYKEVEKEDETVPRYDKIANIPMHCKIDNSNNLLIKDIDKSWYVRYTKKRIKQYLGG